MDENDDQVWKNHVQIVANAWKNNQANPDDYIVHGPKKYYTRQRLIGAVRVFMKSGEGNINLGENAWYAEDGDQEHDVGPLGCSAEGGAEVAYIAKPKKKKSDETA